MNIRLSTIKSIRNHVILHIRQCMQYGLLFAHMKMEAEFSPDRRSITDKCHET